MPAYNFKGQFADAVESGRKPHTIRPRRKRPTRVGDTLYLYTGMRTKKCRLLRTATCRKVTPIAIYTSGCSGLVKLNGREMPHRELHRLAIADGFFGIPEFLDFFADNYGPNFEGELIEWRN
ncbi:MAG: ASCH domain-containing protein [Candidatus Didemnitutus sp.]|nr:ASCH domain-containing protein [Candidatus Didemnitutus sp.]